MVKYISNEAELPVLTLPQWCACVDIFDIKAINGLCVSYGIVCVRLFIFWRCLTIANAKEMLINEQIEAKEIRVIGADGEQLGIMSTEQALRMAYNDGLDLVMMTGNATPPVCKIMNFGKFRFEREKKEKEAKKKQQVVELKEIQLSCRIENHDFETKLKHARRFLEGGDKVKVCVKFKGREMSHTAIGQDIITRFGEACTDIGVIEKQPVLDGRQMIMFINSKQNTPQNGSSKKKAPKAEETNAEGEN